MNSPRPSDARRKALAAEISLPTVSNFFPIERYYDAAQTLFDSVMQTKYDDKQLELCYVYAKRYCMFVLEAIPDHHYYGTAKYRMLQKKHTLQVQKVLDMLEGLVDRMDQDCLEREKQKRIREERERLERERKQQRQIEEWQQQQQRIQQQKKKAAASSTATTESVQQSALDKLKLLSGNQEIATGVPVAATRKRSSTRYGFGDDSETDEDSIPAMNGSMMQPLPPPLLPPTDDDEEENGDDPAAPPSYQAVVRTHKYHPFFGPAEHGDHTTFQVRPLGPPEELPLKPKEPQKPKPMRQLQEIYRNHYLQFQKEGKIQVLSLDTYQGRVTESTNGCTVISALIAARHLNSSSSNSIGDATVKNIIDSQCGPFLREIRRKLGLGGHALIIPSDVHDHLVDAKILQQDYFAGAAGGNIMDHQHYGEFLQLLTSPPAENGRRSNGKAAATLFFREHVISIVKFRHASSGQSQFDLIDSLPSAGSGRATRTRCVDAQALEVLLQWYASRKFSDSNCTYIDRNPWDDAMADLDPRVFQGFVWST